MKITTMFYLNENLHLRLNIVVKGDGRKLEIYQTRNFII